MCESEQNDGMTYLRFRTQLCLEPVHMPSYPVSQEISQETLLLLVHVILGPDFFYLSPKKHAKCSLAISSKSEVDHKARLSRNSKLSLGA